MALALAAGAPPPGLGGTAREAFAAILAGRRAHWRLEARWTPAPASPGLRTVEVLDTDGGVWLVVPDAGDVELWPSTPTTVFRQLCALLPRADELAA
jgi:hypothetical protein